MSALENVLKVVLGLILLAMIAGPAISPKSESATSGETVSGDFDSSVTRLRFFELDTNGDNVVSAGELREARARLNAKK